MLSAHRNIKDFVRSSADSTIDIDIDGNLGLLPNNRFVNQYAHDADGNGEPEGYALRQGMPEKIAGYHVGVSKVNGNRRTITRQSTTPVPPEEGVWRADGPIVSGVKASGTDRRKPLTPIVEAIGTGVRGFEGGIYGLAIGYSDERRNPTTPTDIRYFTLASNQRPEMHVPEEVPEGARFMDVYMTRRGGGPNTLALQAKVNLERLRGRATYIIRGPWRNRGRPPSQNLAGLGTPRTPRVGIEARVVPAKFGLAAGSYRIFAQLNDRGPSLLSVASSQINVTGDKELVQFEQADGTLVSFMAAGQYKRDAGISIRAPRFARRAGIRWTYWVLYQPPEGSESSGQTWYRAYPRTSRFGASTYFNPSIRSITIHGYAPDAEPRGLRVGLTQEEPPTEDGSVLEAPDPTSTPDAPIAGGTETPAPGGYLVDVTGVTESGRLTKDSEPASITIATGQTIRVRFARTVNLLPNAEFSRLDADGKPEGLTPINMGAGQPGSYSVSGGVLRMETATSTTALPRMDFPAIPVSREAALTVAGSVAVTRRSDGSGRIVLRQLDASGTVLADTVVADLATTGAIPFGVRYGAGGAALEGNTVSVVLIARMAGTAANLDMEVSDLQVLALPSSIRKLENGSFDASPATPVPASSFIAAAPAPPVVGAQAAEPAPPLSVVDFESGAWPAAWVDGGSGATGTIEAAARLHETLGYRVQDLSQTVAGSRFRIFQLPAGESSAALRSLVRVTVGQSVGSVFFNPIDSGSRALAFWRLDEQKRLWVRYWNGSTYQETLVAALSVGDLVDLELVASGVGTASGQVTASVGRGGPRQTVVEAGGLDFRGHSLQQVRLGVTTSSDNRARFTLDFDQVVATRKGDILNRESAEPPAGTTPPLPDRPLKGGAPRQFDPDGEQIGQVYVAIMPGEGPVRKPLLERPLAVKPGMTYTDAIFARWTSFTDGLSRVLIRLDGDGVQTRTHSVLDITGERGWHPNDPTLEEDDYTTYTVPEGYTRLSYELVLHDGVYVFQEPLNSQGDYALFAARDARRGYGRAASGEMAVILRAQPPASRPGPHTLLGEQWSDFGVASETALSTVEAPTGLSAYYSTSADGAVFTAETSDPDAVEPASYLRTRVTLSGDGRDGPTIPSGGIFLSTWSRAGALLRADGSAFPGGAFVGDRPHPTRYPEIEAESVGGHHISIETSEEIGRVLSLSIGVYTEAAAQEIEAASLREEFIIELPLSGGTLGGRALTVRFREQVNFETLTPPEIYDGEEPHKALYATTEVEECEVFEDAPLKGPMQRALA